MFSFHRDSPLFVLIVKRQVMKYEGENAKTGSDYSNFGDFPQKMLFRVEKRFYKGKVSLIRKPVVIDRSENELRKETAY